MGTACSPGLCPREGICPTAPPSERRVFEFLCNSLPPDWYAWHSLKVCAEAHDFVEADFLIASPAHGVLILEVKGGAIRKEGGVWYQNGRPMDKSPLSQALHCRGALVRRFNEYHVPSPQITVAVCFPDTPVDDGLTQDDLAGRVLGSESLPYLDTILPSLMDRLIPERREIPKGWVSLLHDMWCETWIPARRLSRRKAEDDERRIGLDRDQLRVLDLAGGNDRVIIEGPPGSGKTILAMELAHREAARNRRVLFLCFTEALGKDLAGHLAHPMIKASAIGVLAISLLRAKGIEMEEEYTPEFWEPVTLQAACEALSDTTPRWDTVIVDEAQDMGENDWAFIEACAAKDARLWIFMDPSQLFLPKRALPPHFGKDFMRLSLGRPYRCPAAIQALADKIVGKEADEALIKEGIASGVIKFISAKAKEVDKAIGKEIDALLHEGFRRSDIAVLSLRGQDFPENIIHQILIGGEAYCRATDENCGDEIIGDTFLRFKGLERPAIIITDLRHVTDRMETRLLIALTRATSVVRIVDIYENDLF